MRHVQPEVFLVQRPSVDWDEIHRYLVSVGGESWMERFLEQDPVPSDGEAIVEIGGRLCYRSWEPGLNVNVSKIREGTPEYLGNVVKSGHGSVLEHANYSFIFHNVSRVFTHEQVRHRAGVGVSQESMRFVRLTDIPFWFPKWAMEDQELMDQSIALILKMEAHQHWMAEHFGLDGKPCKDCDGTGDDVTIIQSPLGGPPEREVYPCQTCGGKGAITVPFSEKKAKTSFMRRFAPEGVATGMLCTINVRALRHIIYMRTALGAEEEIRLVMDGVAQRTLAEVPNIMADYNVNEWQEYIPDFLKV